MPNVGQRYLATNNRAAMAALCGPGYPVPGAVIYVTVTRDYPEHEKVQVRPDGLWLDYADLDAHFRPVTPSL